MLVTISHDTDGVIIESDSCLQGLSKGILKELFHVGRDISIPNSHPAPKIVPALGSLILILLSSLDLILAPLSPTSLPEPGCHPGLAVGLFPCSVDLPPT